ncbi:MAG: hypothetical protein KGZ89_07740 [Actinobacteria bacterium]|nr:hypothetical protein [Actinomycetota bacterium]
MEAILANNYDKPSNEYYPTPEYTVLDLFEVIPMRRDWTYLEPCRGEAKSFYKYMPEGSQWAELSEGVDYLTTKFEHVDCIITNPPFSLSVPFLEKSFTEADVIIYLQRANFLGSKKRKEFWNANKPDALITLTKRPKFKGSRNDMTEYCYYIWDRKNRLGLEDTFYFV